MKNISLIIIVAGLVALPMFATDIYVSSLPTIQSGLSTSEHFMKLSLNVYLVGYALSTLCAGVLSDRFSKHNIIMLGLLLFTLASLGIALLHSITALVFLRGLQGLGGGTGTVVARLILKEQLIPTPSMNQLRALGIVGASMSLSPLLGPLLGATITALLGWEAIFLFLGIFALLLLTSTYVLSHSKVEKKTPENNTQKTPVLKTYLNVLKTRTFLFPTVTIGFVCASEFAFIFNSSFFYQKVLDLNPFQYSLLLSIILSSFLIGVYLLDKLTKKQRAHVILRWTIRVCCLATILPLLGWFISPMLCGLLLAISTMITMTGVGIVVPLTQSMALDIATSNKAAVTGLFFFLEFCIIVVIGYLISLFSHAALPMLLGILVSWWVLQIIEPLLSKNTELLLT